MSARKQFLNFKLRYKNIISILVVLFSILLLISVNQDPDLFDKPDNIGNLSMFLEENESADESFLGVSKAPESIQSNYTENNNTDENISKVNNNSREQKKSFEDLNQSSDASKNLSGTQEKGSPINKSRSIDNETGKSREESNASKSSEESNQRYFYSDLFEKDAFNLILGISLIGILVLIFHRRHNISLLGGKEMSSGIAGEKSSLNAVEAFNYVKERVSAEDIRSLTPQEIANLAVEIEGLNRNKVEEVLNAFREYKYSNSEKETTFNSENLFEEEKD